MTEKEVISELVTEIGNSGILLSSLGSAFSDFHTSEEFEVYFEFDENSSKKGHYVFNSYDLDEGSIAEEERQPSKTYVVTESDTGLTFTYSGVDPNNPEKSLKSEVVGHYPDDKAILGLRDAINMAYEELDYPALKDAIHNGKKPQDISGITDAKKLEEALDKLQAGEERQKLEDVNKDDRLENNGELGNLSPPASEYSQPIHQGGRLSTDKSSRAE